MTDSLTPEQVMTDPCVFCRIIKSEEPAEIVQRWIDAIAFVPLNPVTPGHLLIVPAVHVDDALDWPAMTGMIAVRAAEIADRPCNIITSVGAEATQSIRHLHWHIVPRREGDGLTLPWTGQRKDGADHE